MWRNGRPASPICQGGEMVDTHGLGPCAVRLGGSSPLLGTGFGKAGAQGLGPCAVRLGGSSPFIRTNYDK